VVETDLTNDHRTLDDEFAARRYFAKFERITRILARLAEGGDLEGALGATEAGIVEAYVTGIAASFRALSMKYLIAGRITGPARKHLTIDLHESGFPIYQELVAMANDAAQAAAHLRGMAPPDDLRDRMIRRILDAREIPTDLQYAMSQRLYYEALEAGQAALFWVQMHPVIEPLGEIGAARRRYLLHWAVYDSQLNVPVIYLMDLEDTGRRALPRDEGRWERAKAHLMAQSVAGLKLITIGKGFDADFDDLHPKRLRRLFLGPMYSSAFTLQTGPIREVLDEARAPAGDDWALAWTLEELESARVEMEQGWFSATEREVFELDPLAAQDSGATRVSRAMILPQRPFQVLAEKDPKGFREVRKFVVGQDDRVLVYG
jgi:hypothetical protein